LSEIKSEAFEPAWLIAAGAYPRFCLSLDGMLVQHRSLLCNAPTCTGISLIIA